MSKQKGSDMDAPASLAGPVKVKITRRQRFLAHAVRRVSNALARLRQVRQMGNKKSWEWTPEEAEKIMAAIREAADDTIDAFLGREVENKLFRL